MRCACRATAALPQPVINRDQKHAVGQTGESSAISLGQSRARPARMCTLAYLAAIYALLVDVMLAGPPEGERAVASSMVLDPQQGNVRRSVRVAVPGHTAASVGTVQRGPGRSAEAVAVVALAASHRRLELVNEHDESTIGELVPDAPGGDGGAAVGRRAEHAVAQDGDVVAARAEDDVREAVPRPELPDLGLEPAAGVGPGAVEAPDGVPRGRVEGGGDGDLELLGVAGLVVEDRPQLLRPPNVGVGGFDALELTLGPLEAAPLGPVTAGDLRAKVSVKQGLCAPQPPHTANKGGCG